MNSICLMGRLTADPELYNTQSGVAVTSFKLAVDRDYTPKGQEKQADFIPVVAWRQTAAGVENVLAGQTPDREGEVQDVGQ